MPPEARATGLPPAPQGEPVSPTIVVASAIPTVDVLSDEELQKITIDNIQDCLPRRGFKEASPAPAHKPIMKEADIDEALARRILTDPETNERYGRWAGGKSDKAMKDFYAFEQQEMEKRARRQEIEAKVRDALQAEANRLTSALPEKSVTSTATEPTASVAEQTVHDQLPVAYAAISEKPALSDKTSDPIYERAKRRIRMQQKDGAQENDGQAQPVAQEPPENNDRWSFFTQAAQKVRNGNFTRRKEAAKIGGSTAVVSSLLLFAVINILGNTSEGSVQTDIYTALEQTRSEIERTVAENDSTLPSNHVRLPSLDAARIPTEDTQPPPPSRAGGSVAERQERLDDVRREAFAEAGRRKLVENTDTFARVYNSSGRPVSEPKIQRLEDLPHVYFFTDEWPEDREVIFEHHDNPNTAGRRLDRSLFPEIYGSINAHSPASLFANAMAQQYTSELAESAEETRASGIDQTFQGRNRKEMQKIF